MSIDRDAEIASDQDQLDNQLGEDDHGGLFGSGSEDEGSMYGEFKFSALFEADIFASAGSIPNKRRKLGDEELDSGDDESRNDRLDDGVDEQDGEEELQDARTHVLSSSLGRHPDPKPSDGEVSS